MALPPRIPKTLPQIGRTKPPRAGMSREHLAWIRRLPCACCGARFMVGNHAHHLLRTGERGMGLKSPDRYAIPLCVTHHQGIHAAGDEEGYLRRWGIDGRALADRLWRVSGDDAQGERAIARARPSA